MPETLEFVEEATERRPPLSSSAAFAVLSAGAQFQDRVAVTVNAAPERIFKALEHVTLADMKLAWLLGEMRYLPARLVGRHPPAPSTQPFLTTLRDGGTLVLHCDPPHEIVFGSAGQLHRVVDQAPVHFPTRAAFDAFADPDHEKLFIGIRVEPASRPGEYRLILEHATRALSPRAVRKFKRYWRVIKPMGAFVSRELLRAIRTKAQRAERMQSS